MAVLSLETDNCSLQAQLAGMRAQKQQLETMLLLGGEAVVHVCMYACCPRPGYTMGCLQSCMRPTLVHAMHKRAAKAWCCVPLCDLPALAAPPFHMCCSACR